MTGLIVFLIYASLFLAAYFLVTYVTGLSQRRQDFTSLKTVTFGDESAIRPNRAASIISIVVIFFIWGAFTGSSLVPFHVPGPFVGETNFTYTVTNDAGETSEAAVKVNAAM